MMHSIFLTQQAGKVPRVSVVHVTPKPLPDWAREMAIKARPGDRGLGDVIRREIGWKGDEKFERWFRQTLGKKCKGDWSLAMVNSRYPLPPSA